MAKEEFDGCKVCGNIVFVVIKINKDGSMLGKCKKCGNIRKEDPEVEEL